MNPPPGASPLPERHGEPNAESLYLVHHHAGYLRVRATAFVGAGENSAKLAAARRAAEGEPGLRSWSHSPKTGSVVAQYDPERLEADDLLRRIAAGAGFRGVEVARRAAANRSDLVGAFLDGVQAVNGFVGQLTGDRADLRELVPVALVATSAVSFVLHDRRGRLPHWSSALYRAYRVFMHWHRWEVRARQRAERQREQGDVR